MISCNTYRDKSYNQTYGIQVFSLFIISPLLSLIFIVNGMRQNIRTAYFMFALFLSLLAYMLAPISDLASYGYLYYEYQNMSWPQFVTYQLQGEDFIMQITEWLFAQGGIPFGFMRFLQTLLAFALLNSIFFYKIDHSDKIYSNSEILFRYVCYILIFPFVLMVGGVRFGFGVVVMLYGFHSYIDKKRKIAGILLLVTASFIHFSLLYYSLLSFILIHLNISRKIACIALLAVVGMSFPLQSYMEAYMLQNELKGAGYLGDGIWGRQVDMILGINAIVYHWGQRIMLLPLVFAFFKRYNSRNKWLRIWLSYLLFFACIYSAFTLAQRTTVCLMTCSVFLFLSLEERASKFSGAFRRIFFTCSVVICCFDLWTHREQLLLSEYWRLAQPSVLTLTQEYDRAWLMQNAYDRF